MIKKLIQLFQMSPDKFIRKNMDRLVKEYPYIKLGYKYNSFDNSYYMQVNNTKNEKYMPDIMFSFWKVFDDKYPYEYLGCLFNDSVSKITNPTYVAIGKEYEESRKNVIQATNDFIHIHNNVVEQIQDELNDEL